MAEPKYPHDWDIYRWFGTFLFLSGILHYLVLILYCVCEGNDFRYLDPFPRLLMIYPVGGMVYFLLGILNGFLTQLETVLKQVTWLRYVKRGIKVLAILGMCSIFLQIVRLENDFFIILFGTSLW